MLPRPVILIHDLGGSPQDWDRWGLVAHLVQQGGLDPRLIRRFEYGYVRHGTVPRYDAQGDLIQIARRLSDDSAAPGGEACQVDALAAESRALGGPGKVSIVAVGAGGIIARYYLSRRTADALGTRYNGNVDKVILVGTPNRGARLGSVAGDFRKMWWARIFPPSRSKAALNEICRGFETLRERVLAEMPGESGPPISPRALGLLQISEKSFLLRYLNRAECTPKDVRFWCLAGQITVQFLVPTRLARVSVEMHFGDLLTMLPSATTIPGTRPVPIVFRNGYCVDRTRPTGADDPLDWFGGDLPPFAHTRLMQQPEVQMTIRDILTQD